MNGAHWALACAAAVSAGAYAGTLIVAIARRDFGRLSPLILAAVAAFFIQRFNASEAGAFAAAVLVTGALALTAGTTGADAFTRLMVIPVLLTMLAVLAGPFFDAGAQPALRQTVDVLLTLPAAIALGFALWNLDLIRDRAFHRVRR